MFDQHKISTKVQILTIFILIIDRIHSQCCLSFEGKQCVECPMGMHLHRNNCINDVPQCHEYVRGFDCQECKSGFSLDPESNSCTQLGSQIEPQQLKMQEVKFSESVMMIYMDVENQLGLKIDAQKTYRRIDNNKKLTYRLITLNGSNLVEVLLEKNTVTGQMQIIDVYTTSTILGSDNQINISGPLQKAIDKTIQEFYRIPKEIQVLRADKLPQKYQKSDNYRVIVLKTQSRGLGIQQFTINVQRQGSRPVIDNQPAEKNQSQPIITQKQQIIEETFFQCEDEPLYQQITNVEYIRQSQAQKQQFLQSTDAQTISECFPKLEYNYFDLSIAENSTTILYLFQFNINSSSYQGAFLLFSKEKQTGQKPILQEAIKVTNFTKLRFQIGERRQSPNNRNIQNIIARLDLFYPQLKQQSVEVRYFDWFNNDLKMQRIMFKFFDISTKTYTEHRYDIIGRNIKQLGLIKFTQVNIEQVTEVVRNYIQETYYERLAQDLMFFIELKDLQNGNFMVSYTNADESYFNITLKYNFQQNIVQEVILIQEDTDKQEPVQAQITQNQGTKQQIVQYTQIQKNIAEFVGAQLYAKITKDKLQLDTIKIVNSNPQSEEYEVRFRSQQTKQIVIVVLAQLSFANSNLNITVTKDLTSKITPTQGSVNQTITKIRNKIEYQLTFLMQAKFISFTLSYKDNISESYIMRYYLQESAQIWQVQATCYIKMGQIDIGELIQKQPDFKVNQTQINKDSNKTAEQMVDPKNQTSEIIQKENKTEEQVQTNNTIPQNLLEQLKQNAPDAYNIFIMLQKQLKQKATISKIQYTNLSVIITQIFGLPSKTIIYQIPISQNQENDLQIYPLVRAAPTADSRIDVNLIIKALSKLTTIININNIQINQFQRSSSTYSGPCISFYTLYFVSTTPSNISSKYKFSYSEIILSDSEEIQIIPLQIQNYAYFENVTEQSLQFGLETGPSPSTLKIAQEILGQRFSVKGQQISKRDPSIIRIFIKDYELGMIQLIIKKDENQIQLLKFKSQGYTSKGNSLNQLLQEGNQYRIEEDIIRKKINQLYQKTKSSTRIYPNNLMHWKHRRSSTATLLQFYYELKESKLIKVKAAITKNRDIFIIELRSLNNRLLEIRQEVKQKAQSMIYNILDDREFKIAERKLLASFGHLINNARIISSTKMFRGNSVEYIVVYQTRIGQMEAKLSYSYQSEEGKIQSLTTKQNRNYKTIAGCSGYNMNRICVECLPGLKAGHDGYCYIALQNCGIQSGDLCVECNNGFIRSESLEFCSQSL